VQSRPIKAELTPPGQRQATPATLRSGETSVPAAQYQNALHSAIHQSIASARGSAAARSMLMSWDQASSPVLAMLQAGSESGNPRQGCTALLCRPNAVQPAQRERPAPDMLRCFRPGGSAGGGGRPSRPVRAAASCSRLAAAASASCSRLAQRRGVRAPPPPPASASDSVPLSEPAAPRRRDGPRPGCSSAAPCRAQQTRVGRCRMAAHSCSIPLEALPIACDDTLAGVAVRGRSAAPPHVPKTGCMSAAALCQGIRRMANAVVTHASRGRAATPGVRALRVCQPVPARQSLWRSNRSGAPIPGGCLATRCLTAARLRGSVRRHAGLLRLTASCSPAAICAALSNGPSGKN
jgi:hypothetical protein